jgi:gamma-glutamyl-gamma-aminobutyrate hydrolase PuuD
MKKVLIVSRRLVRKNKLINWVSEIYLELLAGHGVMPVIVPIAEATKGILDGYLNDYDGMLMMEGGDINPACYGENFNTAELDEFDALKDEIEIACLRHALENDKAVLGFCRGMQLINILHGGKNHKDVHEFNSGKVKHIDYDNYDGHRHAVNLIAGTPLSHWYGETRMQVNSYHHQGIKVLGKDLQAMATADDGLIEGIYRPDKKFVMGLQFHPERMLEEHPGNYKVFEAYCKAL